MLLYVMCLSNTSYYNEQCYVVNFVEFCLFLKLNKPSDFVLALL